MSSENMNLTLMIWRQESPKSVGSFEEFKVSVSPEASSLYLS